MIGRKAEAVLNRAVRYAVEHEHEYFTLEHVLWSLLAERQVSEAIEACGGEVPKLLGELEAYLTTEIPKAAPGPEPRSAGGAEPSEPLSSEEERIEHPVATLSIQRLIQRALFQVQSAGKDEIQPIDLFVAMFQAKDSHALYSLLKQGVERVDVLNFVSHGQRK
ncbi:MAG: Clp protease N-terminal domain-containing protein, partial [Oligoflexia bacterium]|nr:Clp protease N-terminal domain-containing protein [Oligoflexia bacterium]